MSRTMYLVTGAAGFLGGTICRQLIERGEKVRAFVLPNDRAIRYVPEESGCKGVKLFLPLGMARFLAKRMEKKAEENGEKPVMTTFSVYNLARNNDFDSSKAKRELGYSTRSYRETIHDEIQWLKATGKIA